ncbi:MAG: hypothetical protein ACXAC8_03100 [Candidatus Hodarchaeales archaeon]|jgi:protein-S-isoprenylcysteine O-methyltransferase Ste14
MSIRRHQVKTLIKGIFILIFFSFILSYVIVEFVGWEVFTNFFFSADINVPIFFKLCGLLLIILGIILNIWANYTLLVIKKISLKNRDPFHTPSRLVVAGPFQYTQNPFRSKFFCTKPIW